MINEPLWWADKKDEKGELEIMEKACRLTLIDFGLARDLNLDPRRLKSFSTVSNHTASTEESFPSDESPLDVSVSYLQVRDLSAVGARFFVAPEVLRGLRELGKVTMDRLGTSVHGPKSHLEKVSKGPKKCVSDYGLTADAFSVGKMIHAWKRRPVVLISYLDMSSGTTIKYVVTGVPPESDIEEYLSSRNHPLRKAGRKVRERLFKKQNKGLTKQFRGLEELPANVFYLAMAMTHHDSRQRLSVRAASQHPWLAEPEEF